MRFTTLGRSPAARSGRAIRGVLPVLLLIGALAGDADGTEPGPGDRGGADATLRVASYNVQFVTPDLPLLHHVLREWPGHKPNVPERAEAIAERLACFDIVALQETINRQRRRELLDRLETAGRACGKASRLRSGRLFTLVHGPAAADGSWLTLVGDELALASRLPIVATGGHVYGHAAEADRLAAKGVLHARLAAGPYGAIDLFVTHLQAGDEHGAVRRRQIEELAAFIRGAIASADAPVLVLGDFNIRGSRVDRLDAASDYHFLRRALDGAVAPRRFVDAWLVTHARDPETGSGTKPRRRADGTLRAHEERIDHLFLAGGDALAPRAMRLDFLASDLIVDGGAVGDLSDHAAVLAWRRASPPARIAASGPHAAQGALQVAPSHRSGAAREPGATQKGQLSARPRASTSIAGHEHDGL